MANSPRPGVFALERSKDHGETWQAWQYFADTPTDCDQFFGEAGYSDSITKDDSVICSTHYSKVVPLEGGEVLSTRGQFVIHLFSHSVILFFMVSASAVHVQIDDQGKLH